MTRIYSTATLVLCCVVWCYIVTFLSLTELWSSVNMKDGTNTHHEMDRVPGADSAGCDSEEPMDIDSEKKTREMQEKPTSEPAVPPGRAVSHETVDSTATTDTFNEFPFQLGDIVRASEAYVSCTFS